MKPRDMFGVLFILGALIQNTQHIPYDAYVNKVQELEQATELYVPHPFGNHRSSSL